MNLRRTDEPIEEGVKGSVAWSLDPSNFGDVGAISIVNCEAGSDIVSKTITQSCNVSYLGPQAEKL